MTTQRSVRSGIRDELLADLPGLADRVLVAVSAEIPAYRTLTTSQLLEVEAIAAWGIGRVLDAWVSGDRLGPEDLRRFRGIGAARALDGRPLPVVLRAYRVAGSCVTDLIADRALDRLTAGDALDLARLWMSSIDALSEALYEGHRAASERLDSDRDHALRDLLADLLAGRQATRTALLERSRRLGVSLPSEPLLAVVRLPAPTPTVPDQTLRWQRLVLSAVTGPADSGGAGPGVVEASPERHLQAVHDRHAVALVPTQVRGRLSALVAETGWPAVLLARPDHSDLARSHRLALHVLGHAPDRAFVARTVLDELDAAVVATLSGHPDRVESPQVLLDAALTGRVRIREGLEAYLVAGNATAAAALLGCHPQTMRYRLRRLRELTGRDVTEPWDRFVLEAATTVGPHEPV